MKHFLLSAILAAAPAAHAVDTDQGIVTRFTILSTAKTVPISTTVTDKDDSGADMPESGLSQRIYINGELKASSTGGTMTYNWNVKSLKPGTYEIKVVGSDASGNTNTVRAIATK